MRVIAYIEKYQLFPPSEAFAATVATFPSFTYLGMNEDRSKVIMLLPDKGVFVAIEREPYRVITGPLVGDCPALGTT
ncbi:MAG TPA: hypothetical protein VG734_17405 [Lacunisphaera sp.]|nr:hypothetical protein [Lacunisphaera sp.]